jgi:sugar lactone lactonase YvrE
MADVKVALDIRIDIGEGVLWDVRDQALWWVDVYHPRLMRWDPASGARREWLLPEPVGCFALCEDGERAVLALRSGFHYLNLESGTVMPILDPEPDRPGTRFNDGKCDRHGRFFAGTMSETRQTANGALYRLDPDLGTARVANGVMVANGLNFTADGRTMYWSDSFAATIWRFDYDARTGTPSNRRVFKKFADGEGVPDGAALDAEGFYWSALYNGARLVRIDPRDGKIVREIAMPVRCPTMPAFGGKDLKTIYLTSARRKRSADELAAYPLSGSLFAVEVDVPGLPEPRFKG